MKKPLKLALIVLGSFLGLLLLIALVAPPIVKSYVLEHDKELVGRELGIHRLRINPLTGGVRIKELTLFEEDGEHPFLNISDFRTRIGLFGLLRNKVKVKRASFSGLKVNIEQNHDWFNYTSLREYHASDDTDTVDEPSKYEILLNNIQFDQSQLRYADLAVGSEFMLNNISLKIPSINLSSMRTDVGLDLHLGDSTVLHTQVLLTQNASEYIMKLQVDRLGLEVLEPYVKQSYQVDSLKGWADLDLQIKGNADHLLDCDVKGNIIAHNISMKDPQGNPLASIDTVVADIKRFNLTENYLDLKKLHLSGVQANYTIGPDKVANLDLVMLPDTDTLDSTDTLETDEKAPLSLIIEDLCLDHANIVYQDQSLAQPFNYEISDVVVTSKNLRLDGNNTVELQASLNQVGKLNAVWKGNLSDLENQDLALNLSNVKFSDFSPYSVQFFGYPLEHGTLSFNSHNVIAQGQLNGVNKLHIASPELGEKVKGVEPRMAKVPLKTGLYMLTDKQQQLRLDVPVKGNLNDPEFSYMDAVMTVLGNLVVKVATSPFRRLDSDGDQQYLGFELTQRDFSAAEYSQLDDIAATLLEKPELEIFFEQRIDHEKTIQELSDLLLKRDYYLSTHPGMEQQTLDLLTNEAIGSIKWNDKGLCAFAEQCGEKNKVRSKKDVASVALAVYGKQAEDLLMMFLQHKNEQLRSYLTERKGLEPERVTVNLPDNESMKEYHKESRYEIRLNIITE